MTVDLENVIKYQNRIEFLNDTMDEMRELLTAYFKNKEEDALEEAENCFILVDDLIKYMKAEIDYEEYQGRVLDNLK